MFSRMLLDTFNPYKPAVIDWPRLEADARNRLVSLPIWDIAVQTEGKASVSVMTYAATIADPLLQAGDRAQRLRGRRGTRRCWPTWCRPTASRSRRSRPIPQPRDPEWAFMVTGYSECIDSFFAFGLFEVARRSGYFPPELVGDLRAGDAGGGAPHHSSSSTGSPGIAATCRGGGGRCFELKVLAVWAFLIWERIGIARGLGGAPRRTTTSP